MSATIDALAIVKAVFVKYAVLQGDKDSLTKTEVSKLLSEQIGVKGSNKQSVDFFKDLQASGGSVFRLKDYVALAVTLSDILG